MEELSKSTDPEHLGKLIILGNKARDFRINLNGRCHLSELCTAESKRRESYGKPFGKQKQKNKKQRNKIEEKKP